MLGGRSLSLIVEAHVKNKPIVFCFSMIAILTAVLLQGGAAAQSEAVLVADRFNYPLVIVRE